MKLDYYLLNTYVPELDGPAPVLYEKFLAQVDAAEQYGFDTAWFTEHHFRPFGGMLPSVQVLMSAVAQRTRRIRLGTAVVILPLHHPLMVAEELAMLDILSGGRLDVGVGRGMGKVEYDVFAGNWSVAEQQMQEQLAILQAAWTEQPFAFQGQYYQFPEPVNVWPPPVQQPHPPLWVTANVNPENFRWIGRRGYNLMTLPWILPSFARSRELIGIYREGLAEGGHDPASREVLAMFPAYCGETPEAARREAGPAWEIWRQFAAEESTGNVRQQDGVRRMTYDAMVEDTRAVFGDAAMCRDHLRRLREELGVTHVAGVFHFGGLAQERVLESMQRFGTEVAPVLRAEGAGVPAGR